MTPWITTGIFSGMTKPSQPPKTTLEDAQSTTLPRRPGEPPTARGCAATRAVNGRTLGVVADSEDAYDDRVSPMDEMP